MRRRPNALRIGVELVTCCFPGERVTPQAADTVESEGGRAPGVLATHSGRFPTLEFVRPLRQVVRELGRERYGIAFIQPMLGDQSCQEGTVDPTSNIVTGGD